MIYFIQEGPNGPIKIGKTGAGVEQRLEALQIGNSKKLRLLLSMPGGRRKEMELHDQFSAHWIRGEWFVPAAPLLGYIEKMKESLFDVSKEYKWSYPILWRETPTSLSDPCPFCGGRHGHGTADGHRVAHCMTPPRSYGKKYWIIKDIDGQEYSSDQGYIVRTRAK